MGRIMLGDFSFQWIPTDGSCEHVVDVEANYQSPTIYYPNPAKSFIHFHRLPSSDGILCKIISANGELVIKSVVFGTMINVEELTSGHYLLKLFNHDGNEVLRERFVKE